jgi:hypothetical protein
MNRIFFTVALIILCMWSCHKESLQISKPLSSGAMHSHRIEATYDSTVKDLEARIALSEVQIKALRGKAVKGPQRIEVMSPQEPLQYKAENPPE